MPSATWLTRSYWDALSPIRQLERASSSYSGRAHGANTSSLTTAPRGYPPPRSATPCDSPAPAEPSVPIRRPVGTARSHERPSASNARPSALNAGGDLPSRPPPLSHPGRPATRQPAPVCSRQVRYEGERYRAPRSDGAAASEDRRAGVRARREDDRTARSAMRNEPVHAHAQRDAPPTRAGSPHPYEQARTCARTQREDDRAGARSQREDRRTARNATRVEPTHACPQRDAPPTRAVSPHPYEQARTRAHRSEREIQPAARTAPARSPGGPTGASATRRGMEPVRVRDGTVSVSTHDHPPSGLTPPPRPRAPPVHLLSIDVLALVTRGYVSPAPSSSSDAPSRFAPASSLDALSPRLPPTRALSPCSQGRANVYAYFAAQAQAAAQRKAQARALAQHDGLPARPSAYDEPPPERSPARALSPQSHARALVHAHHEREAHAAEQAARKCQDAYSTERVPAMQTASTPSSGGPERASATSREGGQAGWREGTTTVSVPAPQPAQFLSPSPPRARPAHPPSHDTRVLVKRTPRPPPSPALPAHRAHAPPADAIQPARNPRVGAPSPACDVYASTPRRHVDQPARQAPHLLATSVHVPRADAPFDAHSSRDPARPAAAVRLNPSTTRDTAHPGDFQEGRRAARECRAPGGLSSLASASSTREDGPARAYALFLHASDSRPPSHPFEQAALASVEHDHRRLASPSFGVPASALRKHDGPPMCQAPHLHADGTLGKHAPPTVAPFDARASPDSVRPAAASRPSLSTAHKTSSSDNLRDGCRAVRDHRSPGSLPSSASSCRTAPASTPRLSHPPDSLASVPPSRKEEPDLAGLDEELRRRIWQVRARSRLVTEDSPESVAIADEEAALRREIWQARARARLAPRPV